MFVLGLNPRLTRMETTTSWISVTRLIIVLCRVRQYNETEHKCFKNGGEKIENNLCLCVHVVSSGLAQWVNTPSGLLGEGNSGH